jgi:endonuclease/exonuclease/phosphatase family metal-dependent hydrolase
VRLLSYNIRFGGTGREAPLAEVLQRVDADVVLFQEASDPRVIAHLADACGYEWWGARERYSTGFVSRIPVRSHRWERAPVARHAVLELTLDTVSSVAPARPVTLYGLHLSAWFSKWSERRRAREIRALLESVPADDTFLHLIAGDFNALAPGERLEPWRMPRWIQAMIWLSGRDIARTTIQSMLDAGYQDSWALATDDVSSRGLTFPTWDPHVRLDYWFVPARFADVVEGIEVIRDPVTKRASDHHPLLLDVRL